VYFSKNIWRILWQEQMPGCLIVDIIKYAKE